MKQFNNALIFLLILLTPISIFSLENTTKSQLQPSVTLYGSAQCKICQNFFKNMKKDKIKYKFLDVNKNRSAGNKMWKKVQKIKPFARSVRFPVIDIEGSILVSPNYAQFKQTYDKHKTHKKPAIKK